MAELQYEWGCLSWWYGVGFVSKFKLHRNCKLIERCFERCTPVKTSADSSTKSPTFKTDPTISPALPLPIPTLPSGTFDRRTPFIPNTALSTSPPTKGSLRIKNKKPQKKANSGANSNWKRTPCPEFTCICWRMLEFCSGAGRRRSRRPLIIWLTTWVKGLASSTSRTNSTSGPAAKMSNK